MGRQAVQCPWNFADLCWTRAPWYLTRLFHGVGCSVRHGPRSWDSRHGPQPHHCCPPARQPRDGAELVAFFLWHRNRDHGHGGYVRISIGHRMAHDFPDFYHCSAAGSSRIPQRRSASAHLGQRRQTDTAARSLCRNSSFVAVNVAIFLGGALELGMAQWLPAYAEMSLGFSKSTGSVSLLAFSAAMALGRIFFGLIGRRVNPIRLMLGCCWTSVVLFLLACFAPWPAVALAASVAVGLAGSCLWPTTLGVAADRFPVGGASMFGLLAAFGKLGGNTHAVAGRRNGGLVIPAARLGNLDSMPSLDGLCPFVDAAPS